jgi:hypothetical protein
LFEIKIVGTVVLNWNDEIDKSINFVAALN